MGHHFVLVHGACYGAWCWYKVIAALNSKGHKATAIDLSGCGASPLSHGNVRGIDDYIQPLTKLMAALGKGEKVVLVGHSYGGIVISFAMERFQEKVSVAVFLGAYMPNFSSPPSIFIEETFNRTPLEQFLDAVFAFEQGPQKPATSVTFGPTILSKKLYDLCQPEDLELAKIMVRPNGVFYEELAKESLLSKAKFGSVDRVFVICKDDKLMKEDFQQWIIEKSPPKKVKSIEAAGHMVMLSRPKELCLCLIEIADEYAPCMN